MSTEGRMHNREIVDERTSQIIKFICPILYQHIATAVGTFVTQNHVLTAASYLFIVKGYWKKKMETISEEDLQVQVRLDFENRFRIRLIPVDEIITMTSYDYKSHDYDFAVLSVSYCIENTIVII